MSTRSDNFNEIFPGFFDSSGHTHGNLMNQFEDVADNTNANDSVNMESESESEPEPEEEDEDEETPEIIEE